MSTPEELRETMERLGIPPLHHGAAEIDLHPKIAKRQARGKWSVTFTGTVGAGKTWQAARFAAERCNGRRINAAWCSVRKLLADLKRGMHTGAYDEMLDRACTVTLLVLDDLGTEKSSEWARETLGYILCERYDWQRSTIVTSNLPVLARASEESLADLDQRVSSRLMDGMVIEMPRRDLRIVKEVLK